MPRPVPERTIVTARRYCAGDARWRTRRQARREAGRPRSKETSKAVAEHSRTIADVVMPDMNGRRLAEEVLQRRPDLKILFTTGDTRNAMVHNGALDPEVNLLQKPASLEQLAARVREVLDRRS